MAIESLTHEVWLQCPRCMASCRDRDLKTHEYLRCGRCGHEVKSSKEGRGIQAAWAFSTAGLILMILANMYPVMIFSVAGNAQENHIVTGVLGLIHQGYAPIAALVFFSAIAAPTLHLLIVWYLSAACVLNRHWPATPQLLKISSVLESWNLMPVFAISCVVSVVKLETLGTVSWMFGAFWIAMFSLCSLLTIQFFDRQFLLIRWEEKP